MSTSQDHLAKSLKTAIASSSQEILDMWNIYLTQKGYTTGTLLQRLDKYARASSTTVAKLLTDRSIITSLVTSGADVTAPVVVAAALGSTGIIQFSAVATDNIGVTKVEFYVDGVLKGSDNDFPYGMSYDSTAVTNGSYTLTAKAFDAANNSTTSAGVPFTVDNVATPAGPFDALYASNWLPVGTTTVYTPPVQAAPSKSAGQASPSYTEPSYGTKVFRVAQLSDSPNNGTTKMRHEYSRRCPFNCDSTKFILQNSSGFFFVYDATTFECLDGGVSTADVKLRAVGTNATHPKDPRDWTWHPTDPNKIIFFPQTDGLICYEFDVVTKALTTKFDLTGRLAAVGMGTATKVMSSEGRPSDNARYWGWQVFNGSTTLGYLTYDMQTDTITGSLVTSVVANNVTMSPSGDYIVISASGSGLTYDECAASSTIKGTRAYTRNFSTFKQVHVTTTHMDVAKDYQGNEVLVSLNPGNSTWSAIAQNAMFYIPLTGATGPTQLLSLAASSSQWNSHYSGCATPGKPGWYIFSSYDSEDRGARMWVDDTIILMELKPNPRMYRLMDHRTTRLTYWQEPHATVSRDGLKVLTSVSWDNTASTDAAIAYMIGLPSWIYGPYNPPGNLLGNGSFSDNAGWNLATNCTVTGGKLHCNNTAANVTNSYPTTTLAPGTYNVTYTISDFTAGNVTMRINSGGTLVTGTTRTQGTHPAGTYTDTLTITSTSTAFEVRVTRSGTAMDVKIDDILIEPA